MTSVVNQDQIDRRMNDFAARSFRDMADRDYIAARMACRAQLMPQFLWAAQQSIEKYLKYFLLVNRIKAKNVRHDIRAALKLAGKATIKIDLLPLSQKFIEHVAEYGEYRYLDVSYFVEGHSLVDLDRAVWDLRRHCQILDVFGKPLPEAEERMLEAARAQFHASRKRPPYTFRLNGGFLEKVLQDKNHPARGALVWNNGFFGTRKRKFIRARQNFSAENAPLYLFPYMLDQLLQYVLIPGDIEQAYRRHLAEVLADPSKLP